MKLATGLVGRKDELPVKAIAVLWLKKSWLHNQESILNLQFYGLKPIQSAKYLHAFMKNEERKV